MGRWVPILAPSLVRGSDTSGDACESLLGVAHLLSPPLPLRLTDPVTLGCLLPWRLQCQEPVHQDHPRQGFTGTALPGLASPWALQYSCLENPMGGGTW